MSVKTAVPIVEVVDSGEGGYNVRVIRHGSDGFVEARKVGHWYSRAEAQSAADFLWSGFCDAAHAGFDSR